MYAVSLVRPNADFCSTPTPSAKVRNSGALPPLSIRREQLHLLTMYALSLVRPNAAFCSNTPWMRFQLSSPNSWSWRDMYIPSLFCYIFATEFALSLATNADMFFQSRRSHSVDWDMLRWLWLMSRPVLCSKLVYPEFESFTSRSKAGYS
jgi:hypothetical protein